MELNDFLTKEQDCILKEIKIKNELNEAIGERMELYKTACKNGIYWQSTEKKWYREL